MDPIAILMTLFVRGGLWLTAWRALLALALLSALAPVHAQVALPSTHAKVARDLAAGLADTSKAKVPWLRDVNGVRQVQAIVVSNSADPAMTALRAAVLRCGGTIHAVHAGVRALTVQVRPADVIALAQRRDV